MSRSGYGGEGVGIPVRQPAKNHSFLNVGWKGYRRRGDRHIASRRTASDLVSSQRHRSKVGSPPVGRVNDDQRKGKKGETMPVRLSSIAGDHRVHLNGDTVTEKYRITAISRHLTERRASDT